MDQNTKHSKTFDRVAHRSNNQKKLNNRPDLQKQCNKLIILSAGLKGPRPGPGPKNWCEDRTLAQAPMGPHEPHGPLRPGPSGPIWPMGS